VIQAIKYFLYRISGGYSLLPFQFTINIANPCNRKCNFCPNHAPGIIDEYPWGFYQQWWRRQPPYMDVDKFAGFIKRMGVWRRFIRQISFTGRGETLLHKDILKFCEVAERYRIRFHITTNGDRLTKKLEEDLSKFRYLHYVRISLFEPEKYEYWQSRAAVSPVRIKIQNVTNWHIEGLEDGYISTNNAGTAKYSTMPDGFVDERHCVAPFSFNTLNTDGTLVTCIAFVETGNVFYESWWECWNGKRMREHRKKGFCFNIDPQLAFCRDCGYMMSHGENKERYWKQNKLKNCHE
jgi:MoaA/NifB/PqqE/SkfB family radical SAM enzyme